MHRRQLGRQCHVDDPSAEAPLDPGERRADQIVNGLPVAPQAHLAGFKAHQVKHIRNQLGHFMRLGIDGMDELCTRRRIELEIRIVQCAARTGNDRERRAQVM